ncbi:MAG: hypothetical protein ACI9VO_001609 [Colwellia sp.]|jgi:hypothetical protein
MKISKVFTAITFALLSIAFTSQAEVANSSKD